MFGPSTQPPMVKLYQIASPQQVDGWPSLEIHQEYYRTISCGDLTQQFTQASVVMKHFMLIPAHSTLAQGAAHSLTVIPPTKLQGKKVNLME